MLGFTEEQIAWFGLTFGVSGFMLYMLFIIFQLARESKAGRFGTFVLFMALGFGMVGFIAKGIIRYFIDRQLVAGGAWHVDRRGRRAAGPDACATRRRERARPPEAPRRAAQRGRRPGARCAHPVDGLPARGDAPLGRPSTWWSPCVRRPGCAPEA
jgi:hypothetical protein